MPGTSVTPCSDAAVAASAQPRVVSWSVSATVSSPRLRRPGDDDGGGLGAVARGGVGVQVDRHPDSVVRRPLGPRGARPVVTARRPLGTTTAGGLRWSTPGRASSVGDRCRAARLLAAAGLQVALLGHHDLAPEDAHDGAVLVVADRLDVHDAAVVLARALPLVEHGRLAVEGVAVEGRRDVPKALDLEVGDRLAGHVGHRHAEQERVDVVARRRRSARTGCSPRRSARRGAGGGGSSSAGRTGGRRTR